MTNSQPTIMAVHAHPDDEVVFTGGTLALYHDRGVRTVLVTATGGEEGEIHDPNLDPDEARPRLGDIRREELRQAVEILKIDHHEMLNYRDSGMAGTDANQRPDSFHNADMEEATARLVALVRLYKPNILITYDDFGAYGHPDHIKCNILARAAYSKAGDNKYRPDLGEPWQPSKLYYTHWPEENWKKAREMFIERGMKWPFDRDEEEKVDKDLERESIEEVLDEKLAEVDKPEEAKKEPEYVPPPITARIDVRDYYPQKHDATLVHRTQFEPGGAFTEMPEDISKVAFGEEAYSLIESRVKTPEQETDLLEGLEVNK